MRLSAAHTTVVAYHIASSLRHDSLTTFDYLAMVFARKNMYNEATNRDLFHNCILKKL